MTLIDWMQPRDHRAARWTVSALLGVAIVVSAITSPIASDGTGMTTNASLTLLAALAGLIALTILGRHFHRGAQIAWALSPLAGVVLLTAVNLLTDDASLNAQIYFLFTTLYGAAMLRRPGAIVMLLASLTGLAVVIASLEPLRSGLVEFVYVGSALASTTVFLVRSGERTAGLVAELEQLAAIDSLTGLVTRRVLDEAATAALSGAEGDQGTALILIDIDDFKSVNDNHGHPGGDDVLVQLSSLVSRRARGGDVVCRMGGDELALLLPGCPTDVATRRASDIIDDVRAHHFEVGDGRRIPVTVSIGLAHAPSDAVDLRSLYASSDAALYRAKDAGRDRLAVAARH